jgi:cytidine deaminase
MMAGIEEVLALARQAQSRAHAPYSNFRVGAVLEAEDGTLFEGCNVENASLGLTLCAERGVLAAAVAAGRRTFRRLVLVTDGEQPIPPCGGCREFLAEMAPDLPIVSEAGGRRMEWTLRELLPLPFELRVDAGTDGGAGKE